MATKAVRPHSAAAPGDITQPAGPRPVAGTMYPFSLADDRVLLFLIGVSAFLISAGMVVALLLD